MKAFLSLLALPVFIYSAIAAPAQAAAAEKMSTDMVAAKSSDPQRALVVMGLFIDDMNKQINASVAEYQHTTKAQDKQDIVDEVIYLLEEINSLVAAGLDNGVFDETVINDKKIAREVSKLVTVIVDEVTSTVDNVLTHLPLNALQPIVKHLLRNLLSVLKPVLRLVNGLLHTVTGILDSVLGGLKLGGLLKGVLGVLGNL